jgi:monoamine oxidase
MDKSINFDKNIVIIGAGLSGLATAYFLEKKHNISPLILEAREAPGGRMQSDSSIELGATWLGPEHSHLLELLDELNIATFPQYKAGKSVFIHGAANPPHYFDADQNSTYRITGGSTRLFTRLKEQTKAKINCGKTVQSISEKDGELQIITPNHSFSAEKVILTIPPQLASQTIQFTPSLPEELLTEMRSTPTWMSNAIKIGLLFDKPYWREKGLSGTLIAPNGPVMELYDHSTQNDEKNSLMGFTNEALRGKSPQQRQKIIINFLAEHMGKFIKNHSAYIEKDWQADPFTATELTESIYMHPTYGSNVWKQPYMNGKLLFSGSETSSVHGGYMEGAVASAKNAANFKT